jgi:hypothetical protein
MNSEKVPFQTEQVDDLTGISSVIMMIIIISIMDVNNNCSKVSLIPIMIIRTKNNQAAEVQLLFICFIVRSVM